MLISLQNITFSFGARAILEDASWQIGTGERIGLVGSNGTGKSTLLRLMTGAYTPDSGVINKPKDVSLGFFNQDLLSFSSNESILKVGMQAFEKAHEVEKKLEKILKELEHLKVGNKTQFDCLRALEYLDMVIELPLDDRVEQYLSFGSIEDEENCREKYS